MNFKPLTAGLLATSIALTGCMSDDNDSSAKGADFMAIINTAIYPGENDIELVDLTNGVYTGNLTASPAGYNNTSSDYVVTAYGSHYYRIGRWGIDTITKYSILDPNTPVYENYSTIDNPDDPTSNPQQLVFVSETKAYLLRLESPIIWIVNPSAATEDDFKLGEIDLSHYSNGNGDNDGKPEISEGVIVDGKLFVTLQRFDSWAAVDGNSYVAVIDINTDTEIDTTPAIPDNLPGINLKGFNPFNIVYHKDAGLYVQSRGDYNPSYNGGIEKINLDDFSTTMIVDDGDAGSHPYGNITDMTIIHKNLAYFTGSASWQNDTLYQFNPETGEDDIVSDIAGLSGMPIAAIDAGPEESLWVSHPDDANPRVFVIDTANNVVIDEVKTTLDPVGVSFAIK